jgi:hypothetical protein
MSRSDIRAGKAFVELSLKDAAFTKSLRSAGDKLKSFGAGMAGVGAATAGMGAAIMAPLAGALSHFSEVGSALADMSARTGMSAGALAELGYAADMTGSSIGDVEKAIRFMQKSGSTETFDEAAERIAAIQDPAEKTAAAIKTFGKAGASLIPMMEDLNSLRQEAQDLGLVPSDEAVADADAVGDAMDRLKKVVGATVFEVGSALAPAFLDAASAAQTILVGISKFVRENKQLVVTVAAVGVGLVTAGTALVALGGAVAAAGVVLGGIASAIGAIGTVVGAILSPIGILTALVVGGVAAWAMWTESGQKTVSALKGLFTDLLGTFKTTFGGIMDALRGGNLALAGSIAMAGLKVALLTGVTALSSAVGGVFGDFFGKIGSQLLSGDFAGAWQTQLDRMQYETAVMLGGFVSMFTDAFNAIIDTWQGTVQAMANVLLDASSAGGALGAVASTLLGVDMNEEQARAEKLQAQIDANTKKRIAEEKRNLSKAEATGDTAEADRARNAIADAEKSLRHKPVNVNADAKDFASNLINSQAQAAKDGWKGLGDLAAQMESASSAKLDGGAEASNEALNASRAELDRLRAEAATLAEERKNKFAEATGGPGGFDGEAQNKKIFASFSAAALAAAGQGQAGQSPTVRKLDEVARIQRDQLEEQRRTRRAIQEGAVFH